MTAPSTDPGYDARRRLAELERLAELQDRLLRRAADRLDALERRSHATVEQEARRAARMLSLREAAQRSGLSARSLKRMIQRGTLDGSAVRVTGSQRRRWLVSEDSLAAFLSTAAARDSGRAGSPR